MLTQKRLVILGADKLAMILMTAYESNYIFQKHLDMILQTMFCDEQEGLKIIEKEIKSLVKIQEPRSPGRATKVIQRIHHARSIIMDTIFPIDPQKSAELIMALLTIQHKSYLYSGRFESHPCIKIADQIFEMMWQDFFKIHQVAPQPLSVIVDIVYQQCLNPNLSSADRIIPLAKDVLGREGFDLLEKRFKALKLEKLLRHHISRGGFRTVKNNAEEALQLIADLQNDPQAYEVATLYFDASLSHGDALAIGERYLRHKNGHAVLRVLDSCRYNPYKNCEQFFMLRFQAYQLLNEHTKAYDLHIAFIEQKNIEKIGF